MAQTGCPQGTGTGGSGKKLKAEFNKEPHVRGTTSMARAASPDSGDSQFFICFDDASFLNGQYTVWGKVTEGMENVDKIKRGEPVKNPDKIVKAHDGRGRGVSNRAVIPRGRAKHGNPRSRFRVRVSTRPGMTRHPGDDRTPRRHAHRSLRFRTSAGKHRAAAGEPARFRADAGGAAAMAVLRDRSVADLPQLARARRPARRERHQGDRGPAQGPPHRPRDRAEDRGDADQAPRRLALAGAGQAGQEARAGRRGPLRQ